jgi:hypothetical protein
LAASIDEAGSERALSLWWLRATYAVLLLAALSLMLLVLQDVLTAVVPDRE